MTTTEKNTRIAEKQPQPAVGQAIVLDTLTDLRDAPPGTTFLIQKEVVDYDFNPRFRNGFTLKENITLIFQGGCLMVPSGKAQFYIQGNQTAIEAPIDQIFGEGLDIAGSWLCDRAYPQWFDWRVGKEKENSYDGDHIDCAIAINQAIQMKKSGEVFLASGYYYIATPIRMFAQTRLIGEWRQYSGDEYGGTMIIPYLTDSPSDSPWPDQAIVFINTIKATDDNGNIIKDENGEDKLTWEQVYPVPMGLLKGIVFRNIGNIEEISRIPCCIVEGGFTFEDLLFASFRRCIKWGEHYSDCKTIRRCVFYPIENNIDMGSDICYAIEIRGLGDALRIEQCHISDAGTHDNKGKLTARAFDALYLTGCKGGSIVNNIFNSRVLLQGCMAVNFSQNHLERGSQLTIVACDMTIRNNYFEKTTVPPVVVDLAPDGKLNIPPTKRFKDYEKHHNSNLGISDNIFYIFQPSKSPERFPAKEICEYDIALCVGKGQEPYCIHLQQNYRYIRHENGSNEPTGIFIGTFTRTSGDENTPSITSDYSSFDDFNSRSYFLSTECTITPGLRIDATRTFSEVPSISSIKVWSAPGDIPNAIKSSVPTINLPDDNSWPYKYQAQMIMDSARHIAGPIVDVNVWKDKPTYDSAGGQIFSLSTTPARSAFTLRLIRSKRFQLNEDYVDIPVVGTTYLHDNNISVNGYKWRPYLESQPIIGQGPSLPRWIQFRGDNVKCFFNETDLKLSSGWNNYDELVNGSQSFYYLDQWIELNK